MAKRKYNEVDPAIFYTVVIVFSLVFGVFFAVKLHQAGTVAGSAITRSR